MLKIALCDDQPLELESISALTQRYMEDNQVDYQLKLYSHPDELLLHCESERYQLYILDIVMPMINGIEVGREIRRLDRESQIIFVTSEPSFALDAYLANPVNYLLKPINQTDYFDTLFLALSKIDLSDETLHTIKVRDGLRIVPLFTIIACEYVNRSARYTLANGEVLLTRTLQESFGDHILPLLNNNRFLRCHTSYVINMNQVEKFSKEGFVLRGGMNVPISTKQYAVVRNNFVNFILKKEG